MTSTSGVHLSTGVKEPGTRAEKTTTPSVSGATSKAIFPKGRGRRKGSLMFTTSGEYGLGAAHATSLYGRHDPFPAASVDETLLDSTKTISTIEGELLVDFAQSDGEDERSDEPTPPTPPKNIAKEQDPAKHLSGDHYVSMLLKAEIEGDTETAADLKRRGSCILRPGGIGGLDVEAFADSDSDEFEKPKRRSLLPGSEDHRPLVGGFAAAAYEAAREYHYKSQRSMSEAAPDTNASVRRGAQPPPSI